MPPKQNRKRRKPPPFLIAVTVHLTPDILARCLGVAQKAPLLPKASLPQILQQALNQLTKDLPYRDEEQAVGELHTYGVPLNKLLPKGVLRRATQSSQERRDALMERQRYLLSLEGPRPQQESSKTPEEVLEENFYKALYGSNFPDPVTREET